MRSFYGIENDMFFFSLEWVYAKSMIIRRQLASVLAEKIYQSQYSKDLALEVAEKILYNGPAGMSKLDCPWSLVRSK